MNWDFLCKPTDASRLFTGNRLHPDIAAGMYGKIPALSCTILKQWIKLQYTPDEFPWWLEHRFDEPPSHALIIGGLVDCFLMGPNVASRYVIVPPNAPKRPNGRQINAKKPSVDTISAISYWAEFDREARHRTIVTQAQYDEALKIADAVRSAKTNQGVFEQSRKMVATATLWGEPFKAEFDLWSNSDQIMDVKTAADVTPEGFGKAFINFGYNYQASLYLFIASEIGHPREAFSFLCVKNTEPYTTVTYSFRPNENGNHMVIFKKSLFDLNIAVETLKIARENNFPPNLTWPVLEIPHWAISAAKYQLPPI